jgi:hypothetical protein
MGFIKDLKHVRQRVDEIADTLSAPTLQKAKKYDEMSGYIQDIKLSLKDSAVMIDPDTGETVVRFAYSVPSVTVRFSPDGAPLENPFLRAINMLNLVPVSDMQKETDTVGRASLMIKNGTHPDMPKHNNS